MNTTAQIVLLIDADNISSQLIPTIMHKLLSRGKVPIRRAYANWRKKGDDWDELACRYAIKGVQQFDPVSGKNATDQALAMEAMELLHSGRYSTFALVSNDGDFTPLAINLREAGVTVLGFGSQTHAKTLAHACDKFETIQLRKPAPAKTQENKTPGKSSLHLPAA